MRLIDGNYLRKMFMFEPNFAFCGNEDTDFKTALRAIEECPTIDAVPVVRCGECKHCEVVETLIGPDTCCVNQGEMLVHKDVDDYCSWGERRADNG